MACVACNDAAVVQHWAQHFSSKENAGIIMLSDQAVELSRALGVADGEYRKKMGGVRCRRFAMVVENNIITKVHVEKPSGSGGGTCSFADDLLGVL